MKITSNTIGNEVFVAVEGRIDTTNYNEFENAINEVFTDNINRIYLDCNGLNYISSSGLRIFLTIQKKMMTIKGNFMLFELQPGIKEIFDISGFSSIFSIFPDLETAKQS